MPGLIALLPSSLPKAGSIKLVRQKENSLIIFLLSRACYSSIMYGTHVAISFS